MRNTAVLLCLLALGACSHKPPAPQSAASTPPAPATPWDDMKKDEQRAKDVQKLVDKQAADQDKQIEQQTQ